MEYSDVTKLETQLISALKEEYSFYQSLFIIIDKQRDYIKFEKEQKLVDLYGEVERILTRIRESEKTMSELRSENRNLFNLAASAPEVRRLVNSITTLITRSLKITKENEETANTRYQAIKEQMEHLHQSRNVLNYLQETKSPPQFVDGKS